MLKEIKKGIYSPDGLNLDNPEQVVIAVHPYYTTNKLIDQSYKFYKSNPNLLKNLEKEELKQFHYEDRLAKLVKTHQGPLITFEGESNLDRTAARYLQLGRKHNSYFIKTCDGGTRLIDFKGKKPNLDDWCKAIEFINQFQGKPWLLTGGYYYGTKFMSNNRYDYNGCLGGIIEEFEKRNEKSFKVLKKITF